MKPEAFYCYYYFLSRWHTCTPPRRVHGPPTRLWSLPPLIQTPKERSSGGIAAKGKCPF
ncbi:hypothetical protein B0H19DRAFT_595159 [Mycena capillaripes]|nr:hypothetical protein B0H19DRAFT_595159 [Mycena capillaripes]